MTSSGPGRLHPARLVARADAGGGLTRITLDVGDALARTYTSPGQYVEAHAGGEPGYFVLASDPGAAAWELILRAAGGASDHLLAMPPGESARVDVSAAIGDGFPMAASRGAPLVVALGGTGIAAGGPIVRWRLAAGDAARTTVLVGARSRAEVALEAELVAWAEGGVDVVLCLSKDSATSGAARRGSGLAASIREVPGYVQDALLAEAGARGPYDRGTRVLAVGMPTMVEALRAIAPAIGLDPSDVLTNH